MDYELITAFVFGLLMLGVAFGVVVASKPFTSALFLLATLMFVAVHFALLGADFLAVLQVMIYIGAIAVLIIFMVILLGAGNKPSEANICACPIRACLMKISAWLDRFFDSRSKLEFALKWAKGVVAQGIINRLVILAFKSFLVLVFTVGVSVLLYFTTDWNTELQEIELTGSIDELGRVLFVHYAWVVELVAVLILVAIIGAVMLAHEEKRPLLPGRGLKAKQN
jgi:NADH-quinone oxidoreductase subunit J